VNSSVVETVLEKGGKQLAKKLHGGSTIFDRAVCGLALKYSILDSYRMGIAMISR